MCNHKDHIDFFSGGEKISFMHQGVRVAGQVKEVVKGDGREPNTLRIQFALWTLETDESDNTIECIDG